MMLINRPATGWLSSAALIALSIAASNTAIQSASAQVVRPDRETYRWRDLENELRNKMTGTYTVTSAGDFLWQLPVSEVMSQQLREVMQKADTTVGNIEGQIIDQINCAGSCGFGNNWMPKETAQALAGLGVDFVAPGEFDGFERGHFSTVKLLDEVGIKSAGAGYNLVQARMPAFQYLPQGRVAFVHACPGNGCGPRAADKFPATHAGGERAGVNALGLATWITVSEVQLAELRAIRDSVLSRRGEPDVALGGPLPKDSPGRLSFGGVNYIVGDKPGEYHYEVDPTDEQAQILMVRNAKENADFVMFSMHVHQNRYMFQAYSYDHYPPNYLRPFIHKLIDNGLDMYVGSGNHTMQGIEIYKGRPIFYNHGNLGSARFGADDSPPNLGNLTNIEDSEYHESWLGYEDSLMAYIANTKYQDGKLVEIRIYPVDLGIDSAKRPWSRMSVPQTPSPEVANRILTLLQKYSEPFGTKISIEKGIGIIRVPADATAPVGGDLVIPGRGPGSKPASYSIGARPGDNGATWPVPEPTPPNRAVPQVRPK